MNKVADSLILKALDLVAVESGGRCSLVSLRARAVLAWWWGMDGQAAGDIPLVCLSSDQEKEAAREAGLDPDAWPGLDAICSYLEKRPNLWRK